MGMLLDFAVTPRGREAPVTFVPAMGAEIVIFPGVRMEPQSVDLGARVQHATPNTSGARRPDA